MSNVPPFEPPNLRRFWPNFVVAAVLAPLVWVMLEGLTMPDDVIGFYIVSISAVPIVFALVLLPAWRLVRGGSNTGVRIASGVLALPSVAVVLWGTYTSLWLIYLVLAFDF
ncbi:MAG TPA: hypothetical protein VHA70_16285 [Bauldia sp.]|nr:hypothetical protein [Bauldia sp.]